MRNIAVLVVMTITFLASATAQQGVLDLPTHGAWVKVQDTNEVIQWSIIAPAHPTTRVDYISSRDNDGSWKNYYLVRSKCANGDFAVSTLKPGNKLGLGSSCAGAIVAATSTVVNDLPRLPAEALLPH
jgi:hypothetical protein